MFIALGALGATSGLSNTHEILRPFKCVVCVCVSLRSLVDVINHIGYTLCFYFAV